MATAARTVDLSSAASASSAAAAAAAAYSGSSPSLFTRALEEEEAGDAGEDACPVLATLERTP